MKKRILGLDIGIASVGWALVEFDDEFKDDNEKKGNIIKSGVRIFTRAEIPKEKESLAKIRREARSQRRRIRGRVERLDAIKDMFIKNGLVSKESVDKNNSNNIYITLNQINTPWQLRMEALDRKLTNEEFAVVLTHLAKHRGYKSLRKSDLKDDETGKMLKEIIKNREKLKGYRTLGEMFCKDKQYESHKRNKSGEYINSVERELIEKEAGKIFDKQREEGNKFADISIENEYLKIAFSQKPVGSINKMVGFCTFENEEKRAPKDSYSAELFKVLNLINNTTITDMETGEIRNFAKEEIAKIIEIVKDIKDVTYSRIKESLKLNNSIQFSSVDYRENVKSKGEREIFVSMKTYHEIKSGIKKISQEKWNNLKENTELLDSIVNIIANFKDDESIKREFQELKIDKDIIDVLLNFEFRKFINLSFKALRKMKPFQLEGQKYMTACKNAGYSLKQEGVRSKFLRVPSEEAEKINVPTVARAFTQTRKVINAVIREYGQFDQINIELANDLKNNKFDRAKIERGQKEFQLQKEKIHKEIQELGVLTPNSSLLLKYRLWKEQDERCVYSEKKIRWENLLDPGFLDVDHIIPYSKSMDDSYNNKVLCFADENRNKKNDIPFSYYKRTGKDWSSFVAIINSMQNMKYAKKKKLLKQELSDIESFIERNVNDTRYATRYIKNFLENNLEFKENEFIKAKVQARSGGLTSVLRYNWGMLKNREESYLHHAEDAIIVACSTQGMVQYISNVSRKYENGKYKMKQIKERTENRIPKPWDSFKEDVERSINGIFVSFAPRHKVTGSAHKDTIYSKKPMEKELNYVTVKKPLDKIKLEDLDNISCNQNSDIIKVLKERLENFNNDPLKAFAEPVHMPTKDSDKKGPIIHSVKIKENNKTGIEVRKGLAERGDMVRVDVFTKDKKYYLVPIYVSDFRKKDLPNKAIVSLKSENEWITIDKTYSFKFSLFKDDLIEIKNKKEKIFGYFGRVHRSTGGIDIKSHYKPKEKDKSLGSRCLLDFKKYQIGVLGNYTEVKYEKRIPAYINTKKG
jgi:CRISPR-associated endonuclease Csn1